MGKKSKDKKQKKSQQEEENRGVQEDEFVYTEDLPKRRRPRRKQDRRHDPHDSTSMQDERDDPRLSGDMKVNPLFSDDDDTRADDGHNFNQEYAHNLCQNDWNQQPWPEYPTNQPKSHPIQDSTDQQYPEEQPRMGPYDSHNIGHSSSQSDPEYVNTRQTLSPPMYLPPPTGQEPQPGMSIPAYPSNMYMNTEPSQPEEMAMDRTEKQTFDERQEPNGQTGNAKSTDDYELPDTTKIILRLISASFIIVDLVMDWIQYAEWTGTSTSVEKKEEQPYYDTWEFVYKIHTVTTHSDIDCDEHAVNGIVTMYLVSCIIAVLFAIFQLVNMVGETLMEIKGKKLKGFQMLHGWIDSSLATFLEEIPQCILVIIFRCKTDSRELLFAVFSALIGNLKNGFRFSTCKHKWKRPKKCCEMPEGKSCCEMPKSCCKVECTIPLCWKVHTILYMLWNSEEEKEWCYYDRKSVNLCDESCKKKNCCFGGIQIDPKWAKNLYNKGTFFHRFLMVILVFVKVIEFFSSSFTKT